MSNEKNVSAPKEKVKVKGLSMRITHGKVLSQQERTILRNALGDGRMITIDTCTYVEPGHQYNQVAPAASVLNIWEK